jgi:hypothetical protein
MSTSIANDPEIEAQPSHLPKGHQKLALKWVGHYKDTKADPRTSTYTLDMYPHSNHMLSCSSIYSQIVNDVSLAHRTSRTEFERRLSVTNGAEKIHFLCKWEGYRNEDATYRFKPYGIQLFAWIW